MYVLGIPFKKKSISICYLEKLLLTTLSNTEDNIDLEHLFVRNEIKVSTMDWGK